MNITKLFAVTLLLWSSVTRAQEEVNKTSEAQANAPTQTPEVIVVTGRLPGPALWKVSKGDNVMWIFGLLDNVPTGMQWETARVEKVLMQAQEYIAQPNKYLRIGVQPGVNLLNPFNLMRINRMRKRLLFNPDGQPLQAMLTPELYQRFTAIKGRYFPGNTDIEEYRPNLAMAVTVSTVLKKQGLASPKFITDRIDKLARKNHMLVRTESGVGFVLNVGDPALEERVENTYHTLPHDKEVACFALLLERMELDVDAIKSRANAWAKGNLDEFREVRLKTTEADNSCASMVAATSEGDVVGRSNEDWLATAERVLDQRQVSFAVLDMGDLLSESGLLSRLRDKGYEIRAPQ